MLRTHLGIIQLQMDPPQIDEAQQTWSRRLRSCAVYSAGPVEVGRNELAQARAHYLAGEVDVAEAMTTTCHETVQALAPLTAADAKSLEGQVHAARGDIDVQPRGLPRGRLILTGVGSDRRGSRDVVRARRSARGRQRVRRGTRRLSQRRGSIGHSASAAAHQAAANQSGKDLR